MKFFDYIVTVPIEVNKITVSVDVNSMNNNPTLVDLLNLFIKVISL